MTPFGPFVQVIWREPGTHTISVNYTSPAGCTAPAAVYTVTVKPSPVPSLSGPQTVCNGATNQVYTTDAGKSNYVWSLNCCGTVASGQGTNTLSANWTFASTQSAVSVTYVDANGCFGTTTKPVTINARPAATITTATTTICAGANVTLGGTVTASGPWTLTLSNGGGTVTGTGNGAWSKIITPSANTLYTITALSDALCTSVAADLTGSTLENVTPRPLGVITSPAVALCAGASTTLSGTVTATGSWTLTLSNSGGTVTGTGPQSWVKNVTPAATTTYTITSLVGTCTALPTDLSGSTLVTVNAKPTATITSPNTIVCPGGSTTLTGTVTALGAWTLTLSNGSTVTGTGTSAWSKSVTSVIATTYTLTALTDANCTAVPAGLTGSTQVSLHPLPAASISPANGLTACVGGSLLLNANTGASLSYQWFKNDVAIPGATNPSLTITETGVYNVQTTSSVGCTTMSNGVTATFNALPTITPLPITPVCTGITTASLSYSTTGSPNQYKLLWTSGPVSVTSFTTLPATIPITGIPVTPGTYTGTLYIKNSFPFCESTGVPVSITVKPKPIVQTGNTTVCSGTTLGLALSADLPGTTFTWSVLTKSSNITGVSTGDTGTGNIGHTLTNTSYSSAGSVTYRITPSLDGCTGNIKDIIVTVNGHVSGGVLGSNQSICPNGNPTAFIQTTAPQGPGAASYAWQSSIDNVSYPNLGVSTALYDANALTQTTYFKRLTSYTQNSLTCSAYNSTPLIVTVVPLLGGEIGTDQTICSGGNPVALTNIQSATGIGPLNYEWEKSTNQVSYTTISGTSGLSTYDPPAGVTQNTYYRRRVSSQVCSAITYSNVITVTIQNIDATITAATTTFCQGQPVDVYLLANAQPGYTYEWKRNGTTVWSGTLPNYHATQVGSYTLTVVSSIGCVATGPAKTISQSNGTGNIRKFGDLCANGMVDLNAGWPSVGSNYVWSTGQTTQVITVYDPGTYYVTYTNAGGCTESASILVERILDPGPCIYARQASPNAEESEPEEVNKQFNVHPNPANEEINITLPNAVKNPTPVELYDAFGRIVYESVFNTGERTKTVSTEGLADGIYMLQVMTPQGGKAIRKVMIKH